MAGALNRFAEATGNQPRALRVTNSVGRTATDVGGVAGTIRGSLPAATLARESPYNIGRAVPRQPGRLAATGRPPFFQQYRPSARSTARGGVDFAYAGGPSLLPGEATSTPKPFTDTIGFPTNPTIPYAKIAKHLPGDINLPLQQFHVLFTRRVEPPVEDDDMLSSRARRGDKLERATMLTLPQLNYVLFRSYVAAVRAKKWRSWTPQSVWAEWSIEGVVVSEEAALDAPRTQERVMNCALAGRAFTFNLWGGRLTPGTRLFFVVKRVPVPEQYTLGAEMTPEDVLAVIDEAAGDDEAARRALEMPFQVVPYASATHSTGVPLNELRYVNPEDGTTGFGIALQLGHVQFTAPAPKPEAIAAAPFNANAHLQLPQMDVLVSTRDIV